MDVAIPDEQPWYFFQEVQPWRPFPTGHAPSMAPVFETERLPRALLERTHRALYSISPDPNDSNNNYKKNTCLGYDTKLGIHQIDILVVYLHAFLDEVIYMEIPRGFELLGYDPNIKLRAFGCCRLLRTLYGLKQSARAWNQRIVGFLKKLGFTQLVLDSSSFVLFCGRSSIDKHIRLNLRTV